MRGAGPQVRGVGDAGVGVGEPARCGDGGLLRQCAL